MNVFMKKDEILNLVKATKQRLESEKFAYFISSMKHCYKNQAHFVFDWLPNILRPRLKSVKEIGLKIKNNKSDFSYSNIYLNTRCYCARQESLCHDLIIMCKNSCRDEIEIGLDAVKMFQSTKVYLQIKQEEIDAKKQEELDAKKQAEIESNS